MHRIKGSAQSELKEGVVVILYNILQVCGISDTAFLVLYVIPQFSCAVVVVDGIAGDSNALAVALEASDSVSCYVAMFSRVVDLLYYNNIGFVGEIMMGVVLGQYICNGYISLP